MGHYNLLIICYCIIFTAFNFGTFLTCYLFGFTYDRDLRKSNNRVFLAPFARFFFYFKGIQSSSRSRPTKLCGGAEIFAFLYFIVMEIANILIAKIFNDFVLSCRVSIVLFVITLIVMLVLTAVVRKKIKAQSAPSSSTHCTSFPYLGALLSSIVRTSGASSKLVCSA